MRQRALPPPKSVRDLLEDLLGRPVDVVVAAPIRREDLHQVLAGVYVDDALQLAAVVGMDFPLAAYIGAAIGLVPARAAAEAVEDRSLTPTLAENAAEVCNILGSLLNREGLPHIRLHQTYLPGQARPVHATECLQALGQRLDLDVKVGGYGGGKLAITLPVAGVAAR